MHIPVIGSMGDYGVFDDYDEDETTRILKGKLNMDFIKITEIILYNWNKYKNMMNNQMQLKIYLQNQIQ